MRFDFLALIPLAFAATDFGIANPATQYGMTYDQTAYPTILSFCKLLRLACVAHNGPIGYHHALTCDINQKGTKILAFCGGVKKLADGTWKKGAPIEDFTVATVASMSSVKIISNPTGPVISPPPAKSAKPKSPKSNSSTAVLPPGRLSAPANGHAKKTKAKKVAKKENKGKKVEKSGKAKVGGKQRTVVKGKKVECLK